MVIEQVSREEISFFGRHHWRELAEHENPKGKIRLEFRFYRKSGEVQWRAIII
jgi:hypothetical protein